MATVERFFGWSPNPKGVEDWLNDPANKHPVFGLAAQPLLADVEKKTMILPEYLLKVQPSWTRISQGIGDCVSHGYEFACTLLMAIQAVLQKRQFPAVVASEAIYGGSRVEARNQKFGGWSDGSYGAAAAKWVQQWGVVVRQDYSSTTGNPEHDLRVYSAQKAKSWGAYGCGGRADAGKLDEVARLHPVQTTSLVTTFEEAAAAIRNGYPVPVCSNQGFTRTRDKDGFCRPSGSWAHCMCFCGVRWDRPGLLCVNSWGKSNSGVYYPKDLPEAIAVCSFWVDAKVCDSMLGRWKDSFALSQFVGFKRQRLPRLGFSFSQTT